MGLAAPAACPLASGRNRWLACGAEYDSQGLSKRRQTTSTQGLTTVHWFPLLTEEGSSARLKVEEWLIVHQSCVINTKANSQVTLFQPGHTWNGG